MTQLKLVHVFKWFPKIEHLLTKIPFKKKHVNSIWKPIDNSRSSKTHFTPGHLATVYATSAPTYPRQDTIAHLSFQLSDTIQQLTCLSRCKNPNVKHQGGYTWYRWSFGVHIFAMKNICCLGYIGDGILPRYMGIVANHYHVGIINKTSMVTWRIIPGLGYVVRMGHPFIKPWSSAIWKGSHNPTNWGLMITMVINHIYVQWRGQTVVQGIFWGLYYTGI